MYNIIEKWSHEEKTSLFLPFPFKFLLFSILFSLVWHTMERRRKKKEEKKKEWKEIFDLYRNIRHFFLHCSSSLFEYCYNFVSLFFLLPYLAPLWKCKSILFYFWGNLWNITFQRNHSMWVNKREQFSCWDTKNTYLKNYQNRTHYHFTIRRTQIRYLMKRITIWSDNFSISVLSLPLARSLSFLHCKYAVCVLHAIAMGEKKMFFRSNNFI